jgi:hypothetical protein
MAKSGGLIAAMNAKTLRAITGGSISGYVMGSQGLLDFLCASSVFSVPLWLISAKH